jgi:hypothetical protein
MRALAAGDAEGIHDGLSSLGYLPDPGAFDPSALLEHLDGAGEWLITPGFRRIDTDYVSRVVDFGYPPRSPHVDSIRRMRLPPATLLLRRMELQLLALLGTFNCGADWGAISAEHHSSKPPSTALGREDRAFFG